MAIATSIVLGLAAQSCGVMSSSSDCAQRATCSDGDGSSGSGSGGGDEGGAPAEAGDDGNDQSEVATSDVTSETAEDVTEDNATNDVGSVDVSNDDSGMRDAMSDADASMIRDVATDEAARVCVPTTAPEDCTDGVDDDCDGLVDCAEASCKTAGYTCTPAAPNGWSGPALLWTGASGSTVPSCPAGYTDVHDANAGLTGGSAYGCNCACNAAGQTCSMTGTFHTDQACSTACASVQVTSNGNCTSVVATSFCGNGGSFNAPKPTPSGGTCTPQVTPTPGTAAVWTTSARLCSWAGPPDAPGGCNVGQQCIGPTAGFGGSLCVYSTADPAPSACPPGYNANGPKVFFSGKNDTRDCGTCTCGGSPTGGSCSGTIALYGTSAGGCSGSAPPTFTLGMAAPCFAYSAVGIVPGYAQPSITVAAGTCGNPTQQPLPRGSVTPTGPTTVCCK